MPAISASRLRRPTSVLIVSAIAMSGGLTLASSPAMAADYTLDCNSPGSNPDVNYSRSGFVNDVITIENQSGTNACNVSVSGSVPFSWTSSAGGGADPTTLAAGATLTVTMTATGSGNLVLKTTNASVRTYTDTFEASAAPSPPPPAASSTQTSSPTFALTFDSEDGSSCSSSSASGVVGSWVALPGASSCTPPASRPDATLLGWATSADFPVEIAQRQVTNGWGAYEIFNADGSIADVFIPAGGSARVAAPDRLYPIWSE